MSKFGWSYPAGMTSLPDERVVHCGICLAVVDECVCPECSICNAYGGLDCYRVGRTGRPSRAKHGMKLNRAQLLSRQQVLVALLEGKLAEEKRRAAALEDSAKPMTEMANHPGWVVVGEGSDPYEEVFSLNIDEQPELPQLIWD